MVQLLTWSVKCGIPNRNRFGSEVLDFTQMLILDLTNCCSHIRVYKVFQEVRAESQQKILFIG